MKIAITTYSLSYGGVGNFIIDLAQFLKNNSFDIEIVCTDSPGKWYYRAHEIGVKTKKFHFNLLGWMPFGRIIHAARIGRYLKKRNFDLIINNHSYFVHSSHQYFRPFTRLLTVIHNQLPQMVQAECRSIPDTIVCVSNRIYNLAIEYANNNKIVTILNGAKFQANYKREVKDLSSKSIKILFVGRIEDRQKAVFLLPGIISSLVKLGKNIHLTIVGAGPDKQKLEKLFKIENLEQIVSFEGLLDADKVQNYYQTHQIFVLPSYFEGLPLTLIEAMGNGCVPVVSKLKDSTDVCIKDGLSGFLVEPGNINQFINKIESLINDSELLNRMSQESIKIANQDFSLETAHSKYLKEINELINLQTNLNIKYTNHYNWWKEIIPFHVIMNLKKFINKLKS